MATQVSLNSGAVASAGALAIQTNGTTQAVSISTGQVATLAQNPILTSGTANGVAYLNGSKALTTGSALTFDGTNLGVGVTPVATWSGYKVLQAGIASFAGGSSGAYLLQDNAYTDNSGASWKYINSSYAAAQYYAASGAHVWRTAASGTAGSAITFTQAMTLDASGNLLVGKTAAAVGSVGTELRPGGVILSTLSAATNADLTYQVYSTGAGAYRFYVGMGGTVYATTTTISSISDIRFKENIRDLNVGLSEIMALKPRLYDWKEGKGADIKNARGFIAQEFEEVFPDLIDEWADPAPEGEDPYKSVRQDLIPVLVKAIQEQQALITQLTARITALESA